jgi:hypothetical protein
MNIGRTEEATRVSQERINGVVRHMDLKLLPSLATTDLFGGAQMFVARAMPENRETRKAAAAVTRE